MPAAREITRRPGERLYFSTPVRKGGKGGYWAGDEVREGSVAWNLRGAMEPHHLSFALRGVFVMVVKPFP